MMSPLRRLGALVGAAALVLGLAACNDLTSSSSSSQVDYAACATDDSELQNQNVDRTGKGAFPDVTGDDTPVIAAGKGSEPTDKVLVKTLKQGDGALVCPGATVKVNYVGALWNGTVFDSSYQKGQPIEFSLDRVVKGWGYGLAHTHVGDRVELVIPASLGYGSQAAGDIPANSTLVFVVDVLGASTMTMADESVLTGATATGEELPAGVTVTGDPGVEPTLAIDESVAAPTERKIYTIYKGSGEELADGESFLYRAVAGGFGANGQTQSSWSQAPVEETVTNAGLAGFTVGSRILLVVPIPASQTQSGTTAQASVMVVDIVGTSTME
ncbi:MULTISPECIES: FKBP-type peptidyl-prolyl cis-trans isomerase [Actinomycetaceae]|uniref:FKBP-type peptidyl-prolyl cis-trans isomerase n=1 Tax=Actinomycetaceae TaxID=2049 RepID=UPI0003970840|nr:MULTISPECIES: FKBP-type peptidyl-prolyl cis-trans isomerase [Actinomycetaceae]ERH31622.1 peptidyl-prolyl cis-trans isomerase, FKBP-type [Actinomyces sp. oral taxon 172 str. F0311]WLD78924.1 FKBP-type peptidyl-prolyl cis-trans isomerase [Schaalia sp. HMT-172]